MNLFQTFFPLVLLLSVALVVGWVIPWHKREKTEEYDIDAVIRHNQEALARSFQELSEGHREVLRLQEEWRRRQRA